MTGARPRGALALLAIAVLAGAALRASTEEPVRLGDDLEVRRLRPGFWLHISKAENVPANGLIVRTKRGLLLVDTGWTDDQTRRLLTWAEASLHGRFVLALLTHSHADRAGGLATLRRRGIRVEALDLTVAKLEERTRRTVFTLLAAADRTHADPLGFEAFYPGPGHTSDNLVVWFPEERILFGGCLVKAAAAHDLGNVAEADLSSWPLAVKAVAERYPGASLVVPGHGETGGPAALAHTLELLRIAENFRKVQ